MATVSYAPHFNLVRTVQNNDAALPTEKRYGINMADFAEAVLMFSFHNSATACDVTPWFWSDEANAFLADNTPATVTISNNGLLKVNVYRHGSVFLAVTAITGGAINTDRVKIEAAGLPQYDKVG